MGAERLPHRVVWDDPDLIDQQIDAGEMMRRMASILAGEYREKQFRGEPRYELRCFFAGGFELLVTAGHVYDDRETLSLAIELRAVARSAPVSSCHLSGGIDRVKASSDTLWIRAGNGTVVLLGHGLGGIIEVQN